MKLELKDQPAHIVMCNPYVSRALTQNSRALENQKARHAQVMWTIEEIDSLILLKGKGITIGQICNYLSRSLLSVKGQIHKLKGKGIL